jgi:hypothetical protein
VFAHLIKNFKKKLLIIYYSRKMRIPSMAEQGKPKKSINIVTFGGPNQLTFNDSGLSKLLLHPEVRDRNVVVIAISGAFRKGKSFMLDYLLRYMYKNVSNIYCKYDSIVILRIIENDILLI